jgi:hypothetical protein
MMVKEKASPVQIRVHHDLVNARAMMKHEIALAHVLRKHQLRRHILLLEVDQAENLLFTISTQSPDVVKGACVKLAQFQFDNNMATAKVAVLDLRIKLSFHSDCIAELIKSKL